MSLEIMGSARGFFEARRSAVASTMPRLIGATAFTLSTGGVWGARCQPEAAGSATKLRCATGSSAPSAVTDVRLVAWNDDGTVRGETGNLNGTIIAGSKEYEGNLLAGISWYAGELFWLGVVYVGTTLQLRGVTNAAEVLARAPRLARTGTGYAGGAAPTLLDATGSGFAPWIEAA